MKSLYIDPTSVAELKENIRKLSTEERRELAAFLVTLRHDAIPDYRENLTSLIDDSNEDHWVTIEELDKRLNS
jgi:dsDNA-specific endonuclease/ATPase MutS2